MAGYPGESWILHVACYAFSKNSPVLTVLGPEVSDGEAPVVLPHLAAKRAVWSFPHPSSLFTDSGPRLHFVQTANYSGSLARPDRTGYDRGGVNDARFLKKIGLVGRAEEPMTDVDRESRSPSNV